MNAYTMAYYAAVEKKKTLSFVTTRMDLEGIVLSEICQIEKNKYCMTLFICLIKKQTNS